MAANTPSKKMTRRVYIGVFVAVLIFTVYIGFNLFNISVLQSEYYRSKANGQQLDSFTINANRGTIYDSTGKILAQSSTVWDVIINPGSIQEFDKDKTELICKKVAEICDVDYNDLLNTCQTSKLRYVKVKTKVGKEIYDKITALRIDNELARYSIYTEENTKRDYPNETLAASVIGFTNYDGDGVYGVEAYYDEYLKGVDGKIVTARDANGKAMPYAYETRYAAQNGNSVYLTLNSVLQYSLEKNLELAMTQHKVQNRACGIIMDVNTGAILAMATAPSFDLNNPAVLSEYYENKLAEYEEKLREDETNTDKQIEEKLEEKQNAFREQQWNNKTISELYIPGSVFKVVTAASALEEELLTPDTVVATCIGETVVSDTKIECWSAAGHGTMDLQGALIKSCNPSFIAIGQLLGAKNFTDYFEAFGLTEKTGVDLPGENSPIYVPFSRMGPVELASSAFGQTNKITPLQMITAYAAVVNGGYLVTPHIVDKIVDATGNVIKTNDTDVKRQVISEDTSATMRVLLENVVKNNGGSNAYIEGYRIGGKSGTSEKLDEYSKESMRFVGSMCCFTPADKPDIIMLVMVDEPFNGHIYGSAVAAPVISAVFSECLENVGIYAQYTAEELENQDTTVPYILGSSGLAAVTKLNSCGLKYEFVGDENGIVTNTTPGASLSIPKGGTVVVYMDEAEKKTALVPNVIGMTVEQANTAITAAGLNISLSGGAIENENAKAVSQSIEAGAQAYRGAVVEVKFMLNDETG
ncbi:MAG: penicillin-binding transpeptidase domain-containing protein [Firmicutes bacterium]|nr:penicillin-binding transpeptidase domain-containing protein [[Eubacterium] siraeum]MCM1486840.1 penicillin-binding transpeptidase domain-containing protein [Bacillota bacterium]